MSGPPPAQPRPDEHDAELEAARTRVGKAQEAAASPGIVAQVSAAWAALKEDVESKNRAVGADVEEGRRRLEEKRRKSAEVEAAGGVGNVAAAAAASGASSVALPALSADDSSAALADRALGGFNTAFPFLGMMAAFSTIELIQKEKLKFDVNVLTRGSKIGAFRWLPVGVGAAIFYPTEFMLRGPMHKMLSGLPLQALQPKPLESEWQSPTDAANWGSKAVGGALAGGMASIIPMLGKWEGFRTPAGIAAMVAACSLGALFMPDFEEVEQRSRSIYR